MRRALAVAAGALLLLATGAAAMEPPPPNPLKAADEAPRADAPAPAATRDFPSPAPGAAPPPPNPRRGLAAVASALPPQDEAPVASVPGLRPPPPRPSRIPGPGGRGLMLLGIYGDHDRPRALIRLPSGAVHRAAVGQSVAGATITRITRDGVFLRAGARETTLTMPR